MASLSDYIEDYIKKMIALSSRRYIDIQRGELAQKFNCVPSQINYVLSTRFSPERGYLVESKRGGRGYIRIFRLEPGQFEHYKDILIQEKGEKFSARKARRFLQRIIEEKQITLREARLLEVILDEANFELAGAPDRAREIQGNLFRAALEALLKGYA
ncbi:MAG TPA: CtsR family transcriptional regulator [Bacillota bacterium]|jgi:transcriptional regulator CtsR|nr:CtsR family transcriptional regulator [Bacillota bacterium]HOB86070.1 CtsR family transcriptional regulator [Bacillota bacterium]HOP68998.1 CtsR family transcriptional regulator [Bacillota bacterium]HPT34057.1 CtsR family transcriptional regulator [Bacillota bacterium]HPZ64420.1 CtsR family transcriptional regulator [Bacillota bacterium]